MLYPELSNGQKILINTGYTIIDAVVDYEKNFSVFPVGHKCFMRCDCYVVPEELDRLNKDAQFFADYVAQKIKLVRAVL